MGYSMFKNAKQVGMVGVKNWINFWSFNFSHRLDGDDDDAEPPDASVGGSTDDVTQSSRGRQNDSGPCNIHVWTHSCGESSFSLSGF